MLSNHYFSYRGYVGADNYENYLDNVMALPDMVYDGKSDANRLSAYDIIKSNRSLTFLSKEEFWSSTPLFDFIDDFRQEELETDVASLTGNEFLIDTLSLSVYAIRPTTRIKGLSERFGNFSFNDVVDRCNSKKRLNKLNQSRLIQNRYGG